MEVLELDWGCNLRGMLHSWLLNFEIIATNFFSSSCVTVNLDTISLVSTLLTSARLTGILKCHLWLPMG